MAKSGFTPNRRGIKKVTQELQEEFSRYPIEVPLTAAPPPVSGVNGTPPISINGGIVVTNSENISVNGNTVTIAGRDVNHNQVEAVAPGYEDLARVAKEILDRLDQLDLAEEDQVDLAHDAQTVLEETVRDEPDKGKMRRALKAIRTYLTPIATKAVLGAADGTGEAMHDWAKNAVDALQIPG